MSEVQYVQKDASVQGYKAVTHDQVVSVARASMVNNGLALSVSQTKSEFDERENGAKMRMYRGWYDISIINIDNPEERETVSIEAHALDNGDKAPGKCCTYAVKTAILKLLWLETGENDESRAEVRNVIDEGEQSVLAGMIGGDQKIWSKICGAYQINHLSQIPKSKYEEVKARLEKFKGAQNANNS
jgi:hypothetical protein